MTRIKGRKLSKSRPRTIRCNSPALLVIIDAMSGFSVAHARIRVLHAGWGLIVLGLAAALGCPGPDGYAGSDEETGADEVGAEPMWNLTLDPFEPTASDSTTGAAAEDGADEGAIFIDPDDGGQLVQCNTASQDCPEGQKCNVWASESSAWNATRCVPIAPSTVGRGETCMVVPDALTGSMLTGIDNCEVGAVCWDPDPVTARGMCVDFCSANGDCKHPDDSCFGKSAWLCTPRCHPFEQNCPTGCACYGSGTDFNCLPDASGDSGVFGDPCEFVNVCDMGYFCAPAPAVPGCQGSTGCCSPYCDLTAEAPCPSADQQCVPWFEPGNSPPEYEDVGACIIPS